MEESPNPQLKTPGLEIKERVLGHSSWLGRALETETPFKVAVVISSEDLLLCWGRWGLLVRAIFSSSVVGFSSEASWKETVARRSYHWGVEKRQCLLVWKWFWHQALWVIKALHQPWRPRVHGGRRYWPQLACTSRNALLSFPLSWAKGKYCDSKESP